MPYQSHSATPTAGALTPKPEMSEADRRFQMRSTCGTKAPVESVPAARPKIVTKWFRLDRPFHAGGSDARARRSSASP